MLRRRQALATAVLGAICLALIFSVWHPTASSAKSDGDQLALLYVEGVIVGNGGNDNPFSAGQNSSSIDLVQKLDKARMDDNVKAVVIRVNSPGGSAAASQEIYEAINRCKLKKPVYISMGDIAASGGYYISSAATRIWATPATLTGSIGVIMELPEYAGLLDKLGVNVRTLKAGAHKDIGSPTRDMTPEETAILQGLLTNTHDQFIKAVADGRTAAGAKNMTEPDVRKIADGTIWTGETAKAAGLVDETGSLRDVLDYAAKKANLPADGYVVNEMKTSFLEELVKSASDSGMGYGDSSRMAPMSPTAQLGQLMGLFALTKALDWVVAAHPAGQPGVAEAPSTQAPNLAASMYLCQPLARGTGLGF